MIAVQDPQELERFVAFLRERRVSSYLEVGVRFGGTFEAVVMGVPTIVRAVAIDPYPTSELYRVLDRLRRSRPATDIQFIRGHASDLAVAEAAGRFDAIFIDGDHRYQSVRDDWETYHRRGLMVAFHDIAKQDGWKDRDGVPIEVPRLWQEIKNERSIEIVAPGSFMGIGIHL